MTGLRTAMKSGPRLPQLEKALAQKRRPNTAKKYINKLINFFKKWGKKREECSKVTCFTTAPSLTARTLLLLDTFGGGDATLQRF